MGVTAWYANLSTSTPWHGLLAPELAFSWLNCGAKPSCGLETEDHDDERDATLMVDG